MQQLVADKLREMLEAKTILDLQQAYWQLDGMILAGAPGDRKKAKETFYRCLEQLAPADDIPPIDFTQRLKRH